MDAKKTGSLIAYLRKQSNKTQKELNRVRNKLPYKD